MHRDDNALTAFPNFYPAPTGYLSSLLLTRQNHCQIPDKILCMQVFGGITRILRIFFCFSAKFTGTFVDSGYIRVTFERSHELECYQLGLWLSYWL
ncbi:hypothetical protein SUGI_0521720 [Cryptomeria japonica]|nr:hypothetical protein SUGI_0521720 [Cryptomeria japonica]